MSVPPCMSMGWYRPNRHLNKIEFDMWLLGFSLGNTDRPGTNNLMDMPCTNFPPSDHMIASVHRPCMHCHHIQRYNTRNYTMYIYDM